MSALKVACLLALVFGVTATFLFTTSRETNTVYEPPIKHIEPASPCPWRDADKDMTHWFPGATGYQTRDLILSDKRTEMRAQLGRELYPEEMALHTYLVMSNEVQLGTVMTRRIKGEHGAIEFAMAIDPQNKLKSLKIQRIREPDATVNDLARYNLEQRFAGFSATNNFTAELLPGNRTANSAHDIARAIASEVKASLVLLEAGSTAGASPHRHH